MSDQSLEELLCVTESTVELLRNAQVGPNVYPGVPAEFTNWRDEQRAWQETCVLYNQSYHMAELMVEGPDALKLLSSLGVNSFATFEPGKAKQFVPCTPDGYVIGDVILFGLDDHRFNLVGRAPVLNWVTLATRRPATTTCRSSSTSARRCAAMGCAAITAFRSRGPTRWRSSRRRSATRPRS
jgi:syringate O-demethylase